MRALLSYSLAVRSVVMASLLAIGSFTASSGSALAQTPDNTGSAPVFSASFKDFDRKLQPLKQFQGKPLVVYFWATWCKSCKNELPELIALHQKYKAKGVTVLGIAIDNTDKVREFLKEYKVDYPVLIGSDDALALSKTLGNKVGGLPFAVVIDAKGTIVGRLLGETKPGKFEELVRPLAG